MIPSLKSELRKLLTVRSTYFVSVIAIGFVLMLSWLMVWDLSNAIKVEVGNATTGIGEEQPAAPTEDTVEEAQEPPIDPVQAEADRQEWLTTRKREVIMNSFGTAATFVIIIVILQIIHEYRYKTIVHTLTSSNSRSKVFFSKIAVLLGFSVLLGLIAVVASLITYEVASAYYHLDLPAQNLMWGDAVMRGSLYIAAFSSLAAIIAFLSRNIALAIAVFFIFPSMVESLLSLLLKQNAVYLPFSAMSQLVLYNPQGENTLDFAHALLTTATYLVVLYSLTWYMFLKRDAN